MGTKRIEDTDIRVEVKHGDESMLPTEQPPPPAPNTGPTCSHFWKTHANVDRCARCGELKPVEKATA